MNNRMYKIALVFGGLCFSILEVAMKLVLWALVLPGIALNVIGVRVFKTKSYLLQLVAIPALSTILAAEILGTVGKEAVEYCMREKGYNIAYEEFKKIVLEAIRG